MPIPPAIPCGRTLAGNVPACEIQKRYKPIGFGDLYDPESVEGHLNVVAEAKEERRFRHLAEQRQAEREAMKPLRGVAYEKLLAWLRSVFPRPR